MSKEELAKIMRRDKADFNEGIDAATKVIDRLNRPSQMRFMFGELRIISPTRGEPAASDEPTVRKVTWSAAALRGWKRLAKAEANARVRDMAKRMLRKAGAA